MLHMRDTRKIHN